jgi:glycosyltransferase involved in cell wall biosynthesis
MNGHAPKKKILLFADWYEPGYKAGGPIRSCVNFTGNMQGDYEVFVFTADRDLNAAAPYEGIRTDEWTTGAGGVRIFYCSPAALTWRNISTQLDTIRPDFIYLNSMFSLRFTIFPLLITRLRQKGSRIVLSPRGMLRSSAVAFKASRKRVFFRLFRWLGFHRNIQFIAADETEVKDIAREFGPAARISLIPNFPGSQPTEQEITAKTPGNLSLICIGRIHPIKNTDYLLDILRDVKAAVRLTIVGAIEDKAFWAKCEKKIGELPANIVVTYAGEMPNHQLAGIIRQHHIFVLPTRGENFGHAIFEALSLGKPVIISDQTPWRRLVAAKAGWDLPLDRPEAFSAAIGTAAAFGQDEYAAWCRGVRGYVADYLNSLNLKEEYSKLFV